jgi:hypothetical protein
MTMKVWNSLAAAAVFTCLISGPTIAVAEGNLASNATRLPDLEINSADLTFSQSSFELETGKYYRWRIVHDGGEELAVIAPGLFRNSWINQVIINDLEITPYGLHSVEFDDEGTIDIWFVPIRPGEYQFSADGYESRGMVGTFVVK